MFRELLELSIVCRSLDLGLAYLAQVLGVTVYVVRVKGLRIALPVDQMPYVLKNVAHVLCYHDYDQLKEFTPRVGWRVLDVGAYIGVYSLYALSRGSTVVAIEPVLENVVVAELNARMNGFEERLRIVPTAVALEGGVRKLYVAKYRANTSMIREYVDRLDEVVEVREVRALDFATVLRALGPFDLVKIDVEGLELELVEALRGVGTKFVKKLVVEVHPYVVDVDEVCRALENLGYEVVVYDPGLEEQVFVYALAKYLL